MLPVGLFDALGDTMLHLFSISFTGLQYHVGFSAKSNLFVTAPFLTPRAVPMSLQSLDRLGRQGDMKDDSAETLFQSFLQEALRSSGPSAVRSCGMGRDVHSLMFSIQHFLCRPRRRPPSNLP